MTFLWALWWVSLQLAVPITVGYVLTRYWTWPLIQANSPWQYFTYFATPALALASLVAMIALCVRSANR